MHIDPNSILDSLPLFGAYAEFHYRFKYFPFSRYFKKEPEIYFDAPWRINPNTLLPLFLLIKDAHEFPIRLKNLEIKVYDETAQEILSNKIQLDKTIDTKWHFAHWDLNLDYVGSVFIHTTLEIEIQGKTKIIKTDNLRGSSKVPLKTYLAAEPFPALNGWLYGDVHLHTWHTTDQVEFGAPGAMTMQAAKALGLDFLTPSDHSYDLDDELDNFLINDPDLKKWQLSRKEFRDLDGSHPDFSVIGSEEITVRNHKNKNIHFLHFNDDVFFHGAGDGAEKWFKTWSENDIYSVLKNRSQQTISVAAHIGDKPGFLEKILFNRGSWESQDIQNYALDGVQVLNGDPRHPNFVIAMKLWVAALLKGYKLGIYGGSDAHGNFNRYRQIYIPQLLVKESPNQCLGLARTLVHAKSNSKSDIIEGMKAKATAITTGPIGDMNVTDSDGHSTKIGETLRMTGDLSLHIFGQSSTEFGKKMKWFLYGGDGVGEYVVKEGLATETINVLWTIKDTKRLRYLRLEIHSKGNTVPGVYVSTPIWIESNES
jgi:hypothetical protein